MNSQKNERKGKLHKIKNIIRISVQECYSKQRGEQVQTLENMLKYYLTLSNILGLHLVRRGQDGAFAICRWAVASFAVLGLVCLLSIPPAVASLFLSPHFWYKVLILPYIYGFFYSVYSYIQVARYRHDMVKFMEAAGSLKVPVFGCIFLWVMWTLIFPLMIASCSLLLFVGWQKFLFTPSIVAVSLVPAALDCYMGSIVKVLHQAVVTLAEEVERREVWTLDGAQRVMSDWHHMAELFKMFNKVS
ncbi:hypothetical protein E2C01_012233 [Portunus trituberculatus]|uniref:Uncharacterized protein n=1 Tax=Portunus trituberculatus TaxID=210409 RepID=A0A5B7DD58_PORTR|nr:hypothetical protein [Portunus trituberculatus]